MSPNANREEALGTAGESWANSSPRPALPLHELRMGSGLRGRQACPGAAGGWLCSSHPTHHPRVTLIWPAEADPSEQLSLNRQSETDSESTCSRLTPKALGRRAPARSPELCKVLHPLKPSSLLPGSALAGSGGGQELQPSTLTWQAGRGPPDHQLTSLVCSQLTGRAGWDKACCKVRMLQVRKALQVRAAAQQMHACSAGIPYEHWFALRLLHPI